MKPLTIAIDLPQGPGATMLFDRLAADWGAIGIRLVRADKGIAADLRLIDLVAPSVRPRRGSSDRSAAPCGPSVRKRPMRRWIRRAQR